MALTRRVFLAGAGATCVGAAADRRLGGDGHDPNLMVFLSDIHQHDNTVRWKNGPTQANEDRAELTVRQTDFYFNRRWQDKPRPKNWTARVKMHDGRKVTFWYDKPGNFYC